MARLAIRATGDKSRRESVSTGDGEVSAIYITGNRAMFTVSMQYPDVLTVHNYADGSIRHIRAYGCMNCGIQAPEYHGGLCKPCHNELERVKRVEKLCHMCGTAPKEYGDLCGPCRDDIPF